MESQKTQEISGIGRKEEEAYLKETMRVIHANVQNYEQEVAAMQEQIDEMLDHYHDNDPEVYTALSNTVTMQENMKHALIRNQKAMKKPYFGRILFYDETFNKEESLYIGRGGIARDTTHQMVIDWRAPVANAYYENGLGRCSYLSAEGKELPIDLKLKRTYEIEDGKLLEYFDTEVIANDDLLTRYLAKNKQAVLGEIIATIQKEQNDIIRKSPYHSIIVQGVAGSGKTTVAMHRISFILYNYAERFKPDDFYIVGSNRILLEYITGVLPDLDVYGIRQMTMEQLFVRLLYEDWDERKYGIRPVDGRGEKLRSSLRWFQKLEAFCRRIEKESISCESVSLDPMQFVEGIRNGTAGVFDERASQSGTPGRVIRLLAGETIENYLTQNPTLSVQTKINMLNERLLVKVKDEFLKSPTRFTEKEKKAILKEYRGWFGKREWNGSIFRLYQDFLQEQGEACIGQEFDLYDLAALAYLYKRIKETEVISEAHHVVVDEAQDFGIMAYAVLHFCMKDCTYTIMGDVSQNIHFGCGLNDWEELKALILTGERDSFGILKKSYRNTVEISEFAAGILAHGSFAVYPAEPIIRHGDPVQVREVRTECLLKEAAAVCRDWLGKGYGTIAVVTRDEEEAKQTAAALSGELPVAESSLEKAVFSDGVMVLPVVYTKGLEFDTVLVLDPDREKYPVDDGHAKLLYVAATRALHELCILHDGNLTGLITDPLPERIEPAKEKEKWIATASGETAKEGSSRMQEKGDAQNREPSVPRKRPVISARLPQAEEKKTLKAASPTSARLSSRTPAVGQPTIVRKSWKEDFYQSSWESGRKAEGTLSRNERKAESVPYRNERLAASALPQGTRTGSIRSQAAFPAFGDMPGTESLRIMGHSRTERSIRWVTAAKDRLELQSRSGVLRIIPVTARIIRICFDRDGKTAVGAGAIPITACCGMKNGWRHRETPAMVELTTEKLQIRVSKKEGALQFWTRSGQLLMAEKVPESRWLQNTNAPAAWLFPDFRREEQIFAPGPKGKMGFQLKNSARYISPGPGSRELPFLLSGAGYGLMMNTGRPVIASTVPAYGNFLMAEGEGAIDYFFVTGNGQMEILEQYMELCSHIVS